MSETTAAHQWESINAQLAAKTNLQPEQARWVMHEILTDSAPKEELKTFLTNMYHKGEAPEEVDAFVKEMFAFSLPINIPDRAVDIVGTGGDGAHTINISTSASVITTAAGARTVKHGSVAATSKSGAADVLRALGVNIDLTGPEVAEVVHKLGIGFLFAQKFHSSLRYAAPARRELSFPTMFNVLGPLANPAQPKAIALGVANPKMMHVMANVLLKRGVEGFVFRGDDGLDEISLETTTTVLQISDGTIREEKFDPTNLNIPRSPISELVGGEADYNADVTRRIYAGEHGAPRDAVLLNAAAGIAAFKGDFSLSVEQQFANGLVHATAAVDSGKAAALLDAWAKMTQEIVANRPE